MSLTHQPQNISDDVIPDDCQPDLAADQKTTSRPSTDPFPTDQEGPRRQARRQRAQRREAQARAQAIEQARREAKRQLYTQVVFPARPASLSAIRGLQIVFGCFIGSILIALIGIILYFTPLLAVRHIEIIGAEQIVDSQIRDEIKVGLGTPLLQVNTGKVADRIASIRPVASARVQCRYPSTLRVSIVERVGIAMKDFPDGIHLFDRDGVDFLTVEPPVSLPYLGVDNADPHDRNTQAALQVLTVLTSQGIDQISRVDAPSVASITLTLSDGRTVIWGSTDRTREKAQKLTALLTQPGTIYDLSSPDLPTVK